VENTTWETVVRLIIEKGRIAQYLGLTMCGVVASLGGSSGWIDGGQVVQIVLAGVMLAGGVEIAKIVGKVE